MKQDDLKKKIVDDDKRIRVIHLITGLNTGGAEMMLYKLVAHCDRSRFSPVVISLMNEGTIGEKIRALDIPVFSAGMLQGLPGPASTLRLIRLVKKIHPDLIQGWMYHGNLAAEAAKVFLSRPVPVLWNIRHSVFDLAHEKRMTAMVIRLCAKMSTKPMRILYNARTSSIQHQKLGYCPEKTVVIPNGFDTNLFCPSEEARVEIRNQLGISPNTPLIGLIARYHPMKDHANFLQAAAQLSNAYPDVQFLLAGHRVDMSNAPLMEWVRRLKLKDKTHFLGRRKDMHRVTAALDIASISSYFGEGFPNVVGEAMACGVPCVVTDVGDSAWVVGETGKVVPPKNPQALATAWKEFLGLGLEERKRLGRAARVRIEKNFNLPTIISQYENLYEQIMVFHQRNPGF